MKYPKFDCPKCNISMKRTTIKEVFDVSPSGSGGCAGLVTSTYKCPDCKLSGTLSGWHTLYLNNGKVITLPYAVEEIVK
jgi:hypothetical protein